jgi:regulator of protease activity HflC (stomatin/prohibitin superfamily)
VSAPRSEALTSAGPAPAPEDAAGAALEEAVALALQVLKGVTVLLVVAFLVSGVFTVESHEVAFLRRLGVQDDTPLEAGLHWRWQVLDEVEKVDKRPQEVLSKSFDLKRNVKDVDDGHGHDGAPQREGGLDPVRDGYLLTGDASLLHVSLAARVAPEAPFLTSRTRFAGGKEGTQLALRLLLDRAAVHTAAYRGVNALLGGGEGAFREGVKRELAASLDGEVGIGAGFEVQRIYLEREWSPPPQVQQAFGQVTQASQQVDKLRSAAQSAATKIENDGIAEAARIESNARARAQQLTSDANATEKEFQALLAAWRRDAYSVRQRLLSRMLAEALREVGETFLVSEGELRIQLERDTRAKREGLRQEARKRLGVDGE